MTIGELVAAHVPQAFVETATDVVTSLERQSTDTTVKRETAIALVRQRLYVSERVARLLVELGLLVLRSRRHDERASDQ